MEQDIALVVLEHLRHELGVHVLNVDLLPKGQRAAWGNPMVNILEGFCSEP